jgi:hypothetical protein
MAAGWRECEDVLELVLIMMRLKKLRKASSNISG